MSKMQLGRCCEIEVICTSPMVRITYTVYSGWSRAIHRSEGLDGSGAMTFDRLGGYFGESEVECNKIYNCYREGAA